MLHANVFMVTQRYINPYRLRVMFVYAVRLRVQQCKRKDRRPAVVQNRIYLNLLFLKNIDTM